VASIHAPVGFAAALLASRSAFRFVRFLLVGAFGSRGGAATLYRSRAKMPGAVSRRVRLAAPYEKGYLALLFL
jgi:hypothetical protein